MTHMLGALEKRQLIKANSSSGLSIMKKGSAYFSLKFGNVHFKDLMAFTSPMSLDKYMKTWTDNQIKQVQLFKNHDFQLPC